LRDTKNREAVIERMNNIAVPAVAERLKAFLIKDLNRKIEDERIERSRKPAPQPGAPGPPRR
jgi:hypothetical protein